MPKADREFFNIPVLLILLSVNLAGCYYKEWVGGLALLIDMAVLFTWVIYVEGNE